MAEPKEADESGMYPAQSADCGRVLQHEIEEIRAWLRQGGHDDPRMLAVTAWRLIDAGLLVTDGERNP